MDSSTELRPSITFAVDRHLFAGPDAQPIADRDRVEADFLIRVVGADAAGGFRREVEQRPDRAAGLFARAQFEHLAEEHENGDHRRRLEIDRDRAVRSAEGRREQARRDRRDHAVGPGDARAHGDQA